MMSTPIIDYPNDRRSLNIDALYLFLTISLPLLAVTLTIWCVVYQYNKRSGAKREQATEITRNSALAGVNSSSDGGYKC